MGKLAKLICALLIGSLLAIQMVGCVKGLTLTVWEPNDGDILTSSPIYVKGKVSDPKAKVTVNNAYGFKHAKTGEFQVTVTLTEGDNIIEVVAKKGKKEVTKPLTVTYQPEQQPE